MHPDITVPKATRRTGLRWAVGGEAYGTTSRARDPYGPLRATSALRSIGAGTGGGGTWRVFGTFPHLAELGSNYRVE